MKKNLFIATLVFGFIANAQIVNIPDANFKAKLLQASPDNMIAKSTAGSYIKVDDNDDGEIQSSEASQVAELNVYYSSISSLTGIENFTNLQYLDCYYNQLTSLDVSQNVNLQSLNCYNNQLTTLDVSGLTNLQQLECYNNQLTSLNTSGCTNLQHLNCKHNQLTSLDVSQNVNLQVLNCSNNLLMSLDVSQNVNLQSLDCYSNQLTNLDVSQNLNLQGLQCSSNQLPSLDVSQNVNLIGLYFDNNQITSLDVSQNVNLQSLYCQINQLTSLDVSQNVNLFYLICGFNQLTSLNVSGLTNLQRLYCSSNQLTSLNIKNNNTYWNHLEFSNNPNLQYICADEEDVSMVQNKINTYGYASTCHVNSYCSFTPGGTFYTINGNNRFDGDANGCDTNDFAYPNLKLNLTNGTQSGSLIANGLGNFIIPVSAGIHTITPQLENPSYFNISPTTAIIDFPAQASPFTQDFCITPNGVHHDLEVIVIPLGVARPGFDASYKIVYKNKGNQLANPVLTFAFDDAVMDYLSASVSATSQSTGLLTWNLGTLAPLHSGNFVVNFNLNAPTETPPLNGGDFLNYTATISPTATDETPTDNVFALNQEVVNSFDPNDKICLEGETINPSMIGEYVHYQIRFENTGTYPAQNVVVKDMIDTTKFDIATLQMVNTSHSCYTRITGNKVEFIFENINLPFDDATNDGYVVFKIKTLPTLTINSTISNTAEIYFDYNFPIVTNTATSTYQVLANQDFDFANEFSLYPNPVKNILNISAKNGLEIQSLEIYNTLGHLVIAKPNFEQTIDVSALKTGTYFIKVITEKGSGSMKFVKQ